MSKLYARKTHPGWLWGICTACIAGLSVFGRRLEAMVVARVEMIWVAVAVITLLSLILYVFYRKRETSDISIPVLTSSLLLLIFGAVAVYLKILLPVETVHFLIFFCFGWLSLKVFGYTYGIAVVFSMAIGDEILQHFLADRVGDLHDVVTNSLSGLAGLFLSKR